MLHSRPQAVATVGGGGGVKAICLAHLPAGPKFSARAVAQRTSLYCLFPSRFSSTNCRSSLRPTAPLPNPRGGTVVTDSSRDGHSALPFGGIEVRAPS